jgi:hypothetical protein
MTTETEHDELQRHAIAVYCDSIRSLYRNSGNSADRRRLAEALEITATLWDSLSDSAMPSTDFRALALALRDADQGVHYPWLEPASVRGRPPDRSDRWELRAKVAMAIEFLIASGMQEDSAISEAARTRGIAALTNSYEARDRELTREQHLRGSIQSWQKTLKDGDRPRNEAAAGSFDDGQVLLRDFFRETRSPEQLRSIGRDMLRRAGEAATGLDSAE